MPGDDILAALFVVENLGGAVAIDIICVALVANVEVLQLKCPLLPLNQILAIKEYRLAGNGACSERNHIIYSALAATYSRMTEVAGCHNITIVELLPMDAVTRE